MEKSAITHQDVKPALPAIADEGIRKNKNWRSNDKKALSAFSTLSFYQAGAGHDAKEIGQNITSNGMILQFRGKTRNIDMLQSRIFFAGRHLQMGLMYCSRRS